VSPVKYELGFYIPEDDILHNVISVADSNFECLLVTADTN
jgi:hypothetical protein